MIAAPPARAMQFKPKVAPPPKELRQLHRNLFSHRPLAFDSTVQSLMNAKRRIFFYMFYVGNLRQFNPLFIWDKRYPINCLDVIVVNVKSICPQML